MDWCFGEEDPREQFSHHTASRHILSTVLFTVEFDFEYLAKAVFGISLSNTHWIPLPNTLHWKKIALCGWNLKSEKLCFSPWGWSIYINECLVSFMCLNPLTKCTESAPHLTRLPREALYPFTSCWVGSDANPTASFRPLSLWWFPFSPNISSIERAERKKKSSRGKMALTTYQWSTCIPPPQPKFICWNLHPSDIFGNRFVEVILEDNGSLTRC